MFSSFFARPALYLLPLCFLLPLLVSAQQKVNVSLYFGGNYALVNAPNSTTEGFRSQLYSSGRNSNGDSILTFARTSVLTELSHNFEVRPGGEVGAGLDFPINKRWAFSSGIGLSSLSYRPTDNVVSFRSNTAVDTIFTTSIISEDNSGNNLFNPLCDTFISAPIISTITESHDLIFLQIPINISYQAIEEVLTLRAGLFINTPLYTQESRNAFQLNRQLRTRDDGTNYYECENALGVQIDRRGQRFRDFTYGINLGANYHLSKKISIGIQLSRLFLPLYHRPLTMSSLEITPREIKPFVTRGAVQIHYHFQASNKKGL